MKQLLKEYLKQYQRDPRRMATDVAEAAMTEFVTHDWNWNGLRDTSNEIKERVAKELPPLIKINNEV
jgi:hypothetical protein